MSDRINHVKNLIAKFDLPQFPSDSNSSKGKPPVPPKPVSPFQKRHSYRPISTNFSGKFHGEDIESSSRIESRNKRQSEILVRETESQKYSRDSGAVSDKSFSSIEEERSVNEDSPTSGYGTENTTVEAKMDDQLLECDSEVNDAEACQCPQERTDSDSESTVSSSSQESDNDKEAAKDVTDGSKKKGRKNCPMKVINEFVLTERNFQRDMDCMKKADEAMNEVNKQHQLELAGKLTTIFGCFRLIYEMHNEKFWPAMEARYKSETEPWMGAFFLEKSFVVKIYKPFIAQQFENKRLIDELHTSSVIKEAMNELASNDDRMKLGLGNLYNTIFQRITRYNILLQQYIKHLPEDSPDMKPAREAMKTITMESQHTNERIRNGERFVGCTMNIFEKIHGSKSMELQPWEKFIKEGPVEKVSARRNERVQERYLILFTGRLLVCNYVLNGYKIRYCLDMTSMEVKAIEDPDRHPFSFRLKAKKKTIDLKFENQETVDEWEETIKSVVADNRKRMRSYMEAGLVTNETLLLQLEEYTEVNFALGKQAPEWIKDEHCSMCMICYSKFTVINRKHHCRACGKIVCGTCSNCKHPLEFENNESKRVCQNCKNYFTGKSTTSKNESVDDFVLGETLGFSDSSRQFRDCFVQLYAEGTIQIKNKLKDVKPEKVIPIVGFGLNKWEDVDRCFRLCHPSCEYFFTTSSDSRLEVWMARIQEVLDSFSG